MEGYTAKKDNMHGSIFALLKRFIESEHGYSGWINLTEQLGLERPTYQMHEMYPTDELFDILNAAARAKGASVYEMMEKFGEFLVPDLLLIYKSMCAPNGEPTRCCCIPSTPCTAP